MRASIWARAGWLWFVVASMPSLGAGCGGGDGGVDAAADAGRDTGVDSGSADSGSGDAARDTGADSATDAGADAAFDAGPPPDFTEPTGTDTDPFLGGTPAATGGELSMGVTLRFGGSIAGAGNEAWADSDGYAFHVSTETKVQARLHTAPGRLFSVAIHRADRHLVAYWGMSRSGEARTVPVTLAAGDYFVHVAAEPPAPSAPIPYVVELVGDTFPSCASVPTAAFTETESAAGANDVRRITLDAMPRVVDTAGPDAPEATGLTVDTSAPVAFAGVSSDQPSGDDSYLDGDSYRVHTGAGVTELRVLLEHVSADVNMDVFVFDAADGSLVGTGIAISDSPENAVAVVEPDHDYDIYAAARDERRIGGDTALPLNYRVTLCGEGSAP